MPDWGSSPKIGIDENVILPGVFFRMGHMGQGHGTAGTLLHDLAKKAHVNETLGTATWHSWDTFAWLGQKKVKSMGHMGRLHGF